MDDSLTEGSTTGLCYPFDTAPDLGVATRIADGVYWVRMPLPFTLDHINLWLLEDHDGWTIVDTGIDSKEIKGLWENVFAEQLDGRPVRRVIVTHLHPDHAGLAGWLTDKWGIALWMTRTDYLMCRNLAADTGKPAPPEGVRFYRAAGFTDEELAWYQSRFGMFGRMVAPMPNAYRRIVDGESLDIGGRDWRVLVGQGHAPEHACLYCPALDLVISGDQILPTISSNVSVWPTEPQANPLRDWLDSCARLRGELPAHVLVLPSHGLPFRGVSQRLTTLIDGHLEVLAKVEAACAEPQRAVDLFGELFKGEIDRGNLVMAVGEAVAHLNYLVSDERLKCVVDDAGVNRYLRV